MEAAGFHPGPFEEWEKMLGPPGPRGYSLLQLKDHAARFGAHVLAVETSLENLRARKRPFTCVALLKEEHFVLLYDANDSRVFLIDEGRSTDLPIDTFRYLWTKKALLIGPSPFAAEESIGKGLGLWWSGVVATGLLVFFLLFAARRFRNPTHSVPLAGRVVPVINSIAAAFAVVGATACERGGPVPSTSLNSDAPSLRVEPEFHDLKRIATLGVGETREVSTSLKNVGAKPLEILEIRAGCTCTVAELERSRIPPGGHAVLKARIKLGHSPEPRRSELTIHSTDPKRPTVRVTFRWQAMNSLAAEPAACRLAKLKPGDSASSPLALKFSGLAICDHCTLSATADSSLVRADPVIRDDARGRGHDPGPSGSDSRDLGEVLIHVLGSDETREYRQTLAISLRCGTETRARLDVPLSWGVGSGLEVSPARLSIGRVAPGEPVVRRIIARSSGRSSFRILGVESEPPGAIATAKFGGAGDSHAIEIGLGMPDREGIWTSKLVIRTDDRDCPSVTLPMSALIAGRSRAMKEVSP